MGITSIFLNSSIKAIFFGIAFFGIKSLLYENERKKIYKWFIYSFCFAILVVVINLKSRIVLFAIIIILAVENIRNIQKKLLLKIIIFIIISFLIIFSFYYKFNSTAGRLLIYKIDFLLIKKYWLFGIGDNFNVLFNHELAEYFKNGSGNINEKLLAGNTFFAFNEWLGFFIKYGFWGFILFSTYSFFLLIHAIRNIINKDHNFESSVVLLLLIVSLVSYPLAFYFFRFCFIYSTITFVFGILSKYKSITKVDVKKLKLFIIGIAMIYFLKKEVEVYKNEEANRVLKTFFKNGQINSGLSMALLQYKNIGNDGNLCLQISKYYFQKSLIDSTIYFLEKAHEKICTDDLHIFWGDCLMEKSENTDAEKHFLLAYNILPHKFSNKIKLAEFYLKVSDYSNARKIAEEIIVFPEKIPSKKVDEIKSRARQIINFLERKNDTIFLKKQ